MSDKIFINFRSGDAQDTAVLIDQKLSRACGEDRVFRSSRSIPAAAMFEPELLAAVAASAVVVVIIGPNWLARDDKGNRRIDAPADWVRTEIETAMAKGKHIVPVLVGDRRRLDDTDDLPVSIGSLAGRQYLRFHHRTADLSLTHIVDEVRRLVPGLPGTAMPKPTDAVLLTALPAIRPSSDVRLTTADINGRHYSSSVVYRSTTYANSPRGLISFNLGMHYRRLETVVGVLDNAEDAGQTGVFQVLVDGSLRKEVIVKQGRPEELRVDVTDGLNLQLVAYRPDTIGSPLLAGARIASGLSNNLPALAWGNPVLHP
ncbi:TIR domain-containing protein [Umezawaea sp. Da 62-37]|uniref:TIR domain-containing protein n=1 Tax=Umezawaea sp. Da 62-37 TaxID=3075927 RepID=UPI0028F712A5|nr:TIR domain-containing protein [Umezawaea sp. Da 62-37]WNV85331.1 TIR domain-containing protein [Umezawaea sp. Da 62-37]